MGLLKKNQSYAKSKGHCGFPKPKKNSKNK